MMGPSPKCTGLTIREGIGFLDVPGKQATNAGAPRYVRAFQREGTIMRSGLLWLIGIPLPIIIILWLITGHA
jgi:hypothetical protein